MAYEGNRYAGLNRRRQDKASWLEPALTAAGAVVGSVVPGVGTAAGMAAGRALGSAGHSMANGGGAESLIQPGMQAFQTFRPSVPQTGISPQGGGTQPTLPTPDPSVPDFGGMDNQSILQMFMQNPSQFRRGYANGGVVRSTYETAQDWLGMDPVQRAMMQARGLAGNEPVYPTVENGQLGALQQAKHPTLEALASLMPDLLGSLPKPADPRNTKAIGAWAPFAGQALAAPATIAQARRKGANAPIEARNLSRQEQYAKDKAAHESRVTTLSNTLVGNATKPMAERATDAPLSVDMAKQLGHPEWAGLTESQVRLKMQGAPDKPKPKEPPSPKDRAGIANMILDNVRQDKDVSNFVTVRDNYNRIARMARNGSGVGDMSLIFAYMKVLDPTSVVRESEYKNAADAIGRIPQLANLPANWMVGSKLTPLGRAGFVKAAKDLYESQRMAYRAAIEMHRGFAQEYGIDPRLILRNYEALDAGVPDVNTDPAPGPTTPPAGRRTK